MPNKIVLVKPENIFGYNAYPPLGLITVGTILHENNYEVKIINAAIEKDYQELLIKECKDALLVGISCYTSEVASAIDITDFIKSRYDVPIVYGGWHSTLFPGQTCEDTNVDFVVIGEGDYTLLQLVQALEGTVTLEQIQGLVYKSNSNIIVNELGGCTDLEQLPPPDYNLVDISLYSSSKLTDYFSRTKQVWLPYQSSRGCPHRCSFCINIVTDNQVWHVKSAQKVVDEVQTLIERHGLTHLRIIDDNFFVDPRRVKAICESFIENDFNITWDAECRVDYFNEKHVNDEILGLCVKSGLIELTLGCESGAERVLNLMKKDIKAAHTVTCVEQCHKHGIIPRCSFITGIPGETREEMLETANLINKLREIEPAMAVGVATFRPYPKSELCNDLLQQGVLSEPKSLREWKMPKHVKCYVERNYKQPWQNGGSLPLNLSFYYTAAGGVLLANPQIGSKLLQKVNSSFIRLARWRTGKLKFGFPIDKYFYDWFHRIYFRYSGYVKKKRHQT